MVFLWFSYGFLYVYQAGYPSRGMDAGAAKYLEDNVGGVLAKALAEMAKVQPKDALGLDGWRMVTKHGTVSPTIGEPWENHGKTEVLMGKP